MKTITIDELNRIMAVGDHKVKLHIAMDEGETPSNGIYLSLTKEALTRFFSISWDDETGKVVITRVK